jgi:hypothetical protein
VDLIWGIVIVVLGLLAWGGQTLTWLSPVTATRLSLVEAEDSVEAVYWADIRGEALWDLLTLWTLVAAGILLIVGHSAWAYLGLVGGGIYIYFAGRGIVTRLELRRRGFRIGEAASVRLGLVMLGVWGIAGLVTVVAAVNDLA